MQHNKKTREGLTERLAVLGQFEPSAGQLLELVLQNEMRKTVLADDVLDALVAYVISSASLPSLQVMQAAPAVDKTGLSIEMVYLQS